MTPARPLSAGRAASAAAATLLVFSLAVQPSYADSGFDGPPQAAVPAPADQVEPDHDYEQKFLCRTGAHLPNSDFHNPTWGQRSLDLDKTHAISTGAGVSVAALTGVEPPPLAQHANSAAPRRDLAPQSTITASAMIFGAVAGTALLGAGVVLLIVFLRARRGTRS
ncbi:hypothetical protein [Segniliparus rugosus]|uniref:Uncharacterized protein n=1 Tax=Segniliparus rugosus (strain ATCC BAA-974 / DSM 45345 / CCUG 50838 / CIP 108380 / JCM 13579 / CDC 945) TaxID=679197 RepID=E5XNM3_SEGRC|nr:hypothetical protein [Segniliparus rugosus]EFV14013.1 hypothetical protein HMPREF9336_01094 [Segniliparus rugosus ATCC BAA-974]